uniref:Ig-like domain-containing protein n=2 Tax=Cyprinus carpio TaxID=7962 RepID=A0A8C1MTC3_CYPCA
MIVAIKLIAKFGSFVCWFRVGDISSQVFSLLRSLEQLAYDASFSCTLSDASGVKQVTWQRVRDQEPVQTLATFSELFKQHVDDQYVGKVSFTAASVNSTSIEIKNATFEDEACYICSFKVYPFQPKRQTLCLAVKAHSRWWCESEDTQRFVIG